jgi:hypothetical protein
VPVEGYFFFFLPVAFFAFFAFFAFLAMLPSRSHVDSMQVDLDMHKYRVHHNIKIDTARFEEGKRRSDRSALQVANLFHDGPQRDAWTPCPDGNIRTEIDMKTTPQMAGSSEPKQLLSALARVEGHPVLLKIHPFNAPRFLLLRFA